MEAELQAAVEEYRSQLTVVEELLARDSENAEVKEVYEQLQGALQFTLTALAQVDSQPPDGGRSSADGEGVINQVGHGSGDSGAGDGDGGGVASMATGAGAGPWRPPRGGAPNNVRMHPANRYYRQEPDFAALAQQYEELRPYVSVDAAGRAHLDSTSWEATRALTACLLHHDFGIRWWLPAGHLVAPVTNRANYIHWLNDLLHLSSPPGGEPVRGLDIGCGANFIYCLLGAVLYGWHMVGVDVTKVAVECCRQLIADNPQVAPLLEVRDLSALHPELQGPGAFAPAGATEHGAGRRGRKRQARGAGQDTKPLAAADPGSGAADPAAVTHASGPDDLAAADHAAEAAVDQGPGAAGQESGTATSTSAGDGGHAGPLSQDRITSADADARGRAPGYSGEAAAEGVDGAPGLGQPAADVDGTGGEAAAADSWGGNEQGILLPVFGDETFAFTMCNPPFFESMEEAAQNPNTAFGGTAAEMVCPGGELAFVLQMLVESEALQDRVHWFSTMVGKKSTLKALRRELHSRHVTALRTTELAQGKTSRWAVAWSWQVDPNKAAQPLRRIDAADERPGNGPSLQSEAIPCNTLHAAPTAAAGASGAASAQAASGVPLLPRRHISFTVQLAAPLNDRTLLPEVQRLLREQGCGPLQVDPAAWTVSWPLQVAAFRVGEPAAEAGGTAGVKRPRDEAATGRGGFASNITARLRVAQQQRGRMEVVATIPNTSSDAAARAFAGIMAALERTLGAP